MGALPIGILMFLGTLVGFLWRRVGRRRARQQFPELSQELGLDFTAPRYAGGVGTLTGTYQGRTVRVDPDDQRLIKVRFHASPRIDLRTYEHSMRAPFDMVTIHSGDRAFDRFFKTRFATEPIADRIAAASKPGRVLAPFMGRFARHVQSLTVTGDGVVCRLDFGTPPYIPAGALHEILPACASLADLIEPSVKATGSTAQRDGATRDHPSE